MPPATSGLLPARLSNTLASYGERVVAEDGGGRWHLTGRQLLAGAASILAVLAPHINRPFIVYLPKSPLSYALTTCSFLYRLDFCPLDIHNPLERVLDVASQMAGSLILCDSDEVFAELRKRTQDCLKIEVSFEEVGCRLEDTPNISGGDDPSYFIATSGSTGRPKLVQVPHERTIPFLDWAVPFYEIDQHTRWAQFSSVGFDLSLVDFLSVVCGGGTLISLSTQMDTIRPARAVSRCGITHWHSVPSMIPYFLREAVATDERPTCRLFTFCGEPLMKTDADKLAERYPQARIVNTYGPTETTFFCSFFEYDDRGQETIENSLPIGQPIPSWNFVLLPEDDSLRLTILSDNVARGYVGHDSPQFGTVDLFGTTMRAFDTGDYFRVVGSHLYFSHRKDAMVKVKGNRIDLGEIESTAKKTGLVNPVAMVIGNTIALVAEGAAGDAAQIRNALSRYLPPASIPAAVRFVPLHPRTINGKLDRRAIRDAFGGPDEC